LSSTQGAADFHLAADRFRVPGKNRGSLVTGDTVLHDLTYTSTSQGLEQLDVYLPRGAPPPGGWPVILAIHGGGWRRFDKRDYGQRIASAFVSKGYAVVAPNYLLSSPGNPTWPENLQDVQDAVRWVRTHAGQFGFNGGEIAAMGESAGANLANLLGTESTPNTSQAASDSVQAVVSFSSPTDLTALYNQSPAASGAVAQLLGGPPGTVPNNYLAASPAMQVTPDSAPTLLIHGADDPLVPDSQSIELATALTQAGVRNQLILLPGKGHDLRFPIDTPRNLVTQILAFLNVTWKDIRSQSLIH
jgi:acetyl esterase/lipase